MERIITNIPATKMYIGCLCFILEESDIFDYTIAEEITDTFAETNGLRYNSVISIELQDQLALIFRLKYTDDDLMDIITQRVEMMSNRDKGARPKGGWLGI